MKRRTGRIGTRSIHKEPVVIFLRTGYRLGYMKARGYGRTRQEGYKP